MPIESAKPYNTNPSSAPLRAPEVPLPSIDKGHQPVQAGAPVVPPLGKQGEILDRADGMAAPHLPSPRKPGDSQLLFGLEQGKFELLGAVTDPTNDEVLLAFLDRLVDTPGSDPQLIAKTFQEIAKRGSFADRKLPKALVQIARPFGNSPEAGPTQQAVLQYRQYRQANAPNQFGPGPSSAGSAERNFDLRGAGEAYQKLYGYGKHKEHANEWSKLLAKAIDLEANWGDGSKNDPSDYSWMVSRALEDCNDPDAFKELLGATRRLCDRQPGLGNELEKLGCGKFDNGFFVPKNTPEQTQPASGIEFFLEKLASGQGDFDERTLAFQMSSHLGLTKRQQLGFGKDLLLEAARSEQGWSDQRLDNLLGGMLSAVQSPESKIPPKDVQAMLTELLTKLPSEKKAAMTGQLLACLSRHEGTESIANALVTSLSKQEGDQQAFSPQQQLVVLGSMGQTPGKVADGLRTQLVKQINDSGSSLPFRVANLQLMESLPNGEARGRLAELLQEQLSSQLGIQGDLKTDQSKALMQELKDNKLAVGDAFARLQKSQGLMSKRDSLSGIGDWATLNETVQQIERLEKRDDPFKMDLNAAIDTFNAKLCPKGSHSVSWLTSSMPPKYPAPAGIGQLQDFLKRFEKIDPSRREELLLRLGDSPNGWGGFRLGYPPDSPEGLKQRQGAGSGPSNELALESQARRSRYQSSGLRGRLDAVERLGPNFDDLARWARINSVHGEQFDQLLMRLDEVKREADPRKAEQLNAVLQRLDKKPPLAAADLSAIIESLDHLDQKEVKQVLSSGSDNSQMLDDLSELMLGRLKRRAGGLREGFLDGGRREVEPGLEMANFVIRRGKGLELLTSKNGPSLLDRLGQEGQERQVSWDQFAALTRLLGQEVPAPLGLTGAQASEWKQQQELNRNLSRAKTARFNRLPDNLEMQALIDPKASEAERAQAFASLKTRLGSITPADLLKLKKPLSGLQGEALETQKLINLEVGVGLSRRVQSEYLLARNSPGRAADKFPQVRAEVERTRGELTELLHTFPKDLTGSRFKEIAGPFEAGRQALEFVDSKTLELEKAERESEEKAREAELQQQLQFKQGMGFQSIRSLLNLAVNSPGDEVKLNLDGSAGVGFNVGIAKVEAALQVGAGFKVRINEAGQFEVSASVEAGARAGAKLDLKVAEAGAEAKIGVERERTMVFANLDEVAKFLTNVSNKCGLTKEEFKQLEPPEIVDRWVRKAKVEAKLDAPGGKPVLSLAVESSNEDVTFNYPTAWTKAGELQEMPAKMQKRTLSGNMKLNDHLSVGVSLGLTDTTGTKNFVDNGSTLVLALQLQGDVGKIAQATSGGKTLELTAEILGVMLADKKVAGFGDDKAANTETAKKWLVKNNVNIKCDAKGRIELVFVSGKNVLRDLADPKYKGTKDEGTNNLTDHPFAGWDALKGMFDPETSSNWSPLTTRFVTERSFEASSRWQAGPFFAELGIRLSMVDATTLKGTLDHSRLMMYEHRPGVAFDRLQLAELEKDGLIKNGSLDQDAAKVIFAKMLYELEGKWADDPENNQWRAQNLNGMSHETYSKNVRRFLERQLEGLHKGLWLNGNTRQSWEQFRKELNIEEIEQYQKQSDSSLWGKSDEDIRKSLPVR